jgi:branched-chain amino acid transport system permease protein
LQDYFIGATQYWHAVLGAVILLLVLAFPQGVAGFCRQMAARVNRSVRFDAGHGGRP